MAFNNWQVLVVEDEHDSAQVVSQILLYYGVEVFVARNGFECLDALRDLTPTLIITDLAMPGMDGWQTLSEIRANPQTANIPVVAVTAYHSANVAQGAIEAGFDAYYAKPLEPISFMDSLQRMIP
jgi:CheY-like chemotaxis protein